LRGGLLERSGCADAGGRAGCGARVIDIGWPHVVGRGGIISRAEPRENSPKLGGGRGGTGRHRTGQGHTMRTTCGQPGQPRSPKETEAYFTFALGSVRQWNDLAGPRGRPASSQMGSVHPRCNHVIPTGLLDPRRSGKQMDHTSRAGLPHCPAILKTALAPWLIGRPQPSDCFDCSRSEQSKHHDVQTIPDGKQTWESSERTSAQKNRHVLKLYLA
jgi:hypothetical protein